MNMLSKETEALLDKLYNLRSEDSYILAEMEKEKEVAEETKNKTTKQKQELQDKIESLTEEESVLAEQGAHLRDILSGINPDDFKMVLERLKIDFNPTEIKDKIDDLLPGTIEEVVAATKKAEEELVLVEDEMNSAITKIDELAVRKETELANQEKLNEYFELALNGNINITREAITSLISQFNFTEEEQREAAKLMMFPEDALYDYDKKYQDANNHGKSISDVLIEAKESVAKPIGDIFNNKEEELNLISSNDEKEESKPVEESVVTPISELNRSDTKDDNSSISDLLSSSNDNYFPFEINVQDLKDELPSIEQNETSTAVNIEDKNEDNKPLDFDINPIFNNINIDNNIEKEEAKVEEPKEVVNDSNEESMMDLFRRLGLSEIMFVESELEDLINLEDKSIVEKNVNILNKYNINVDIVSDNVNILSDPELEDKINVILNAGKTVDDIYFNPSVLKKYDLKGLEHAIELLNENGLDPKKVPLMAY